MRQGRERGDETAGADGPCEVRPATAHPSSRCIRFFGRGDDPFRIKGTAAGRMLRAGIRFLTPQVHHEPVTDDPSPGNATPPPHAVAPVVYN